MALWTEVVKPAELTVYARRELAEIEREKGRLAQFFPIETVNKDTAEYRITDSGLVEAAEYRAFDSEASIDSGESGELVTIALPPVSRKSLITELDQVRSYGASSDRFKVSIAAHTQKAVRAVTERLELARGRILETGRLTITENGYNVDIDLRRKSEMTVTASKLWSQPDSDPIMDIQDWAQAYSDMNDDVPGAIVCSRRIATILSRHSLIVKTLRPLGGLNFVTLEDINGLLNGLGLPGLVIYDRRVKFGGTINRVLSDSKVFMLPDPNTAKLGKTLFGRTAEAGDPAYSIGAEDAPGLVASAHKKDDPYQHWARANAIALPVLTTPNASMVAQVL